MMRTKWLAAAVLALALAAPAPGGAEDVAEPMKVLGNIAKLDRFDRTLELRRSLRANGAVLRVPAAVEGFDGLRLGMRALFEVHPEGEVLVVESIRLYPE